MISTSKLVEDTHPIIQLTIWRLYQFGIAQAWDITTSPYDKPLLNQSSWPLLVIFQDWWFASHLGLYPLHHESTYWKGTQIVHENKARQHPLHYVSCDFRNNFYKWNCRNKWGWNPQKTKGLFLFGMRAINVELMAPKTFPGSLDSAINMVTLPLVNHKKQGKTSVSNS